MEYLKKNCIYIFIILVLICLLIYFINNPKVVYEEPIIELFDTNVEETIEFEEDVIEIKSVFVDVKGAIKNPGVYELLEINRVIDAINLSGGLLENADTSNINLSKKLKDEMVIIVDFKKEEVKEEITCPSVKEESNQDNDKEPIENDALIDDNKEEINNDASLDDESNNGNNLNSNSKISLNAATKEELMTLPGIGESKALDIIEYRNNSLFKSIEEITNVKGIGNSIYEKIKEFITI